MALGAVTTFPSPHTEQASCAPTEVTTKSKKEKVRQNIIGKASISFPNHTKMIVWVSKEIHRRSQLNFVSYGSFVSYLTRRNLRPTGTGIGALFFFGFVPP
mmetsp:Transcript_2142/g.3077  ORF Transcript_2142/g.3077 Transcript_2142/m.3077 type:complete len:101 (-) Transcript_2142:730-1032(-)